MPLNFPSGSLPIDHTGMSQAMLKQKINFPSPGVRTVEEISHIFKSKLGLNVKWIKKKSTFDISCSLLVEHPTYRSIPTYCLKSDELLRLVSTGTHHMKTQFS